MFTPHRTKSGSDVLIYLAFAERHPSGQRESVYQLAAKRLSLLRSRQR